MNLDFAFVCDYAEVPQKVNAIGIGFDVIYAPEVPYRHPLFFVVAQLRARSVEAGEKNLQVDLIDENGHSIIPTLRGKLNVARPRVGVETTARLAMKLSNVQFPQYGEYSIHVLVEGLEYIRIPLRIERAATSSPS